MSKRELIVAIDGPSAAGKSTAGTRVAKRLGYLYIESGAFYRALAWKVREQGIDPTDNGALQRVSGTTVIEVVRRPDGARILVDQRDATDALRTPEMSRIAAQIASNPLVREPMLRLQRTLAKDGGVVMEGRDIGTVVFPESDVKFYLTRTRRYAGSDGTRSCAPKAWTWSCKPRLTRSWHATART